MIQLQLRFKFNNFVSANAMFSDSKVLINIDNYAQPVYGSKL